MSDELIRQLDETCDHRDEYGSAVDAYGLCMLCNRTVKVAGPKRARVWAAFALACVGWGALTAVTGMDNVLLSFAAGTVTIVVLGKVLS